MKSPSSFHMKRVGNYELGDTLGEGSFGKIRSVVNIKTVKRGGEMP
jgi:hypothetical protein